MARKSIEQLITQAGIALPDNTTGAISPADVRVMITNILDTATPAYGGLAISTRTQTLTATPGNLVFQSVLASYPPEWVTDFNAGTLGRNLGGVPALNSRFTICGQVSGPNNGNLTATLYRGNVATGWQSIVTTRGAGIALAFAFSALDYITQDAVYSLRVSSTVNGDCQFSNVLFLGENVPVRTFNQSARDIGDTTANP